MVAADVHGKNHHVAGSLRRARPALRMRVADGRIVECSRDRGARPLPRHARRHGAHRPHPRGRVPLERIPSPWISRRASASTTSTRFVERSKDARRARGRTRWAGSTACRAGAGIGRGMLIRGRWAEPDEAPAARPAPRRGPRVPFVLPGWVSRPLERARLQRALLPQARAARARRGIVHPETFFYPLDAIGHWNRLYGPRGFTQYQCVLPEAAGRGAARRFLELLDPPRRRLDALRDQGLRGGGRRACSRSRSRASRSPSTCRSATRRRRWSTR